MAIAREVVSSELEIRWITGTTPEGVPILKTTHLGGSVTSNLTVKIGATDQDIYDVAAAIGGLGAWPVHDFERVERNRLVSS